MSVHRGPDRPMGMGRTVTMTVTMSWAVWTYGQGQGSIPWKSRCIVEGKVDQVEDDQLEGGYISWEWVIFSHSSYSTPSTQAPGEPLPISILIFNLILLPHSHFQHGPDPEGYPAVQHPPGLLQHCCCSLFCCSSSPSRFLIIILIILITEEAIGEGGGGEGKGEG